MSYWLRYWPGNSSSRGGIRRVILTRRHDEPSYVVRSPEGDVIRLESELHTQGKNFPQETFTKFCLGERVRLKVAKDTVGIVNSIEFDIQGFEWVGVTTQYGTALWCPDDLDLVWEEKVKDDNKIECKYAIDDRVTTPFGEQGIIRCIILDETAKVRYYAQTKDSLLLYKENELQGEGRGTNITFPFYVGQFVLTPFEKVGKAKVHCLAIGDAGEMQVRVTAGEHDHYYLPADLKPFTE